MREFKLEKHCLSCNLKISIFKYLTQEQLEYVDSLRFEVDFNAGETIFKQGAPLTHIVCITSGLVKIYLEHENDNNIILTILKPTQILGGPGFNTDYKHHFSATAIEDTTACFLDVNIFKELLMQNSSFAVEMIGYLNNTHISFYNKFKTLVHKHMNGRLAETLIYLADDVYNSDKFQTTLSRQDIADMSAMRKESVIRALKGFKEEGILLCENDSFEILQKEALLKISKFG
ncbi:MAG TPA: Crp/Fnr family transcriptional regulator [Bacteroidales bacterium]